jgi:hypothetical protein
MTLLVRYFFLLVAFRELAFASASYEKRFCLKDPSGSTYNVMDLTQLNEADFAEFISAYLDMGYDAKDIGGYAFIDGKEYKLDENCNHQAPQMTTLCVREKDGTGDCLEQEVEDEPQIVEAFKQELQILGMVHYNPGETVDYKGGKGVVQDDCKVKPVVPSSSGDPHFTTWAGHQFDFHGGCDLVLLQNPHFEHGLGLHIHIRTRINTWWSYIECAVIQLGDKTLEVCGGEMRYFFNGEKQGHDIQTGDTFLANRPVHFRRVNDHQSLVRVQLGGGDAISMEAYKDFVRVNIGWQVHQKWIGSAGMLGSFPEGKMVARDGVTILEDPKEFGQEWQVQPREGMLFHEMGLVQSPELCSMPGQSQSRRRLSEAVITRENAVALCSHVAIEDQNACIFDVLATNDEEMAKFY